MSDDKPPTPIEVWNTSCKLNGYHLDAEPMGYSDGGRSWLTPSYHDVEDEVFNVSFTSFNSFVFSIVIIFN